MDINLPGISGIDAMKILHRDPLTAHKLRALQAGAKDFISKPFDLVEVKTRIRNMLEVRLLYKKLEEYAKLLEQMTQRV